MRKQHVVGNGLELVFRTKGDWWVAYIAPSTNAQNERAIEVARLHVRHAENLERRRQFQDLAQECVADAFEAIGGRRPEWKSAPESERSGSA